MNRADSRARRGRVPAATPATTGASAPLGGTPAEESQAAAAGVVGVAVIRAQLRTLPNGPGVYRMLAANGDALYVGKARSLKKRVATYTHLIRLPMRLQRMVSETAALEVVTTASEVEALLLEANLIKRLRPRYNVLLRDDKTYPHILITGDHPFARLAKHRGARSRAGDYFGPFASAGAVNRTITALQRAFLLRNCSDAVFAARTRPCLQYQIKRCTGPCVGRVDAAAYGAQVDQARAFLAGRSREVRDQLVAEMLAASEALEFETAARLRDRVRALAAIQAHQDINLEALGDADVIAAVQDAGQTCIQVFFLRGGRNCGNRAFFPSHDRQLEAPAVLAAFLVQFYDDKPAPALVLLSHQPRESGLIAEALTLRGGQRVALKVPQRGEKRRPVELALANAREALGRRRAETASQRRLIEGLAALVGLAAPPARIEVYDNSHVQGRHAVGAMIVVGADGFIKSAYRKFTIRATAVAGDDYGMMREVLTRRFARAQREDPERRGDQWPDLVVIDGGRGQVSVATEVMRAQDLEDIPVIAVAKGRDRNAGRERLYRPGQPPLQFDPNDPVLYFVQRIRDEAHRFAIGTHRARRGRALGRSTLDQVDGIGPARKKALLHHFGSARAIARAGLADLEAVDGISKAVAQKVYNYFRSETS